VASAQIPARAPRYNLRNNPWVTQQPMNLSSDIAPPVDWDRAVEIDARGQPCPQPLLALRRALREQPPGTLLQLRATDPASWRDIHSFAELSGRALLRAERRGDGFNYWLRATP